MSVRLLVVFEKVGTTLYFWTGLTFHGRKGRTICGTLYLWGRKSKQQRCPWCLKEVLGCVVLRILIMFTFDGRGDGIQTGELRG